MLNDQLFYISTDILLEFRFNLTFSVQYNFYYVSTTLVEVGGSWKKTLLFFYYEGRVVGPKIETYYFYTTC